MSPRVSIMALIVVAGAQGTIRANGDEEVLDAVSRAAGWQEEDSQRECSAGQEERVECALSLRQMRASATSSRQNQKKEETSSAAPFWVPCTVLLQQVEAAINQYCTNPPTAVFTADDACWNLWNEVDKANNGGGWVHLYSYILEMIAEKFATASCISDALAGNLMQASSQHLQAGQKKSMAPDFHEVDANKDSGIEWTECVHYLQSNSTVLGAVESKRCSQPAAQKADWSAKVSCTELFKLAGASTSLKLNLSQYSVIAQRLAAPPCIGGGAAAAAVGAQPGRRASSGASQLALDQTVTRKTDGSWGSTGYR